MRTELPADFVARAEGARADAILRSCVHCGFCNATCPTYDLLGDERDGPRGRIYLMKEMLERQEPDPVTRTHLDRCLTCRACEITCPSGVQYGELLEISRNFLEARLPRPARERLVRRWLLRVLPDGRRLRRWLGLGRAFRRWLPSRLAAAVPVKGAAGVVVARQAVADADSTPGIAAEGCSHLGTAIRRVLLLDGCVQRAATPEVNAALTRLLESRGIEVVKAPGEGCCGSLALHLGAAADARTTMAANVDALSRALDGVDAIVSTASGCGVTVKDYGRLLSGDPARREAAERVAAATRDVAELLHELDAGWQRASVHQRVAWQAPCTLQHGQRVRGVVEELLGGAGYELVPVQDAHLCCGSAGTYSVLQPELASQLKSRKLETLQQHRPDVIATANVGCQLHLAPDADVTVVHWLELLA